MSAGKQIGGGGVPPPPDDKATGLPGFRSWPGVYWFVLGCFVLTVLLLALFTRAFA